jgi:hypothetical protein
VHYPVQSPTAAAPHHVIPPAAAKPSSCAPSQPPRLSPPAQPPTIKSPAPPSAPTTKPPTLSPVQPPRLSLAKPPALPPAMREAKPPSALAPAACSNVFDVRAFGASGNGSSADDTRSFRAAWKEAYVLCGVRNAARAVGRRVHRHLHRVHGAVQARAHLPSKQHKSSCIWTSGRRCSRDQFSLFNFASSAFSIRALPPD